MTPLANETPVLLGDGILWQANLWQKGRNSSHQGEGYTSFQLYLSQVHILKFFSTQKLTCPPKRFHFKRKFHLPTIIFGEYQYQGQFRLVPAKKFSQINGSFPQQCPGALIHTVGSHGLVDPAIKVHRFLVESTEMVMEYHGNIHGNMHGNIPQTSWNVGISDIPGIQPSSWSPHPVRCAKVKATPRQQRSWRQRPLVVRYRSTSNPSCEEFETSLKKTQETSVFWMILGTNRCIWI